MPDRFNDILAGAPSSVPGAPSSVPGSGSMPPLVGGLYTNVEHQETSHEFAQAHFQQVRDVQGRFAGGWGFAWQGLSTVSSNLQDFDERMMANLHASVEKLKDDMVAYAQANAPWEDGDAPTGIHARDALQGTVVWESPERFTIFLGHGPTIYYGVWLEVRWGGKYAIIMPTIMAFAPDIANRIRVLA